MIKFEKISKYKNEDFPLPQRKTAGSAGYDFVVAENITIPAYTDLMYSLSNYEFFEIKGNAKITEVEREKEIKELLIRNDNGLTLEEMAALTKKSKCKPTLVPTGVKCYLEPDTYLELSVRSSCPLKYWLVLANSEGIIDSDYVNNPDNEGHIFFQVINLSPFPIKLQKGDIIGQGIIKHYLTTDGDCAMGERTGGFGSTSKE